MADTSSSAKASDELIAYEEARRRIRSALADGRTHLSLSPNRENASLERLTQFPPEIAELTGLQVLVAAKTAISDLSPLAGLVSLRTLNVNRAPVGDIGPLSGLRNLTGLSLGVTQVTDLSPLAGLDALSTLQLTRSPVSDISPLRFLKNLKSLSLRKTNVREIEPLRALTLLENLNVGGTPVDDLGPLSQMLLLRALHLTQTKVRSLAAIENLSNLDTLILTSSPVTDLMPIARLTRLVERVDEIQSKLEGKLSEKERKRLNTALQLAGIRYSPDAIVDPVLKELATKANPERTREVFAHLRSRVGLPPIERRENVNESQQPDFEQARDAPRFEPGLDGRIALKSAGPPGSEASALRRDLIWKTEELLGACDPSSNSCAHLRKPLESYLGAIRDTGSSLAAAWSPGNSLRRALAADRRRQILPDHERDVPTLPEGIAESLADLVETHNVLCSMDVDLRTFDEQRIGPAERAEAQAALARAGTTLARAVTESRDVFEENASDTIRNAVEEAREAANDASLSGAQAQVVARGTLENAITAVVEKAVEDLNENDPTIRTASAIEQLLQIERKKKDHTFVKSLGATVVGGTILGAPAAVGFIARYGAEILLFLANSPLAEVVRQVLRIVGALG